jgi:tetratricopeptide (TPR) repeat protein
VSDALYERYKEALRRGHVASLRERHDAALAAYVEAATIAPERALPHVSIGETYARLDRPADALVAYDAALERAPGDEAALLGRADALAALGQPAESAESLDIVSAAQEAAGRLGPALDNARRALELAESRTRRRTVEGLVERLRAAPGADPDGETGAALARAVALLESSAVAGGLDEATEVEALPGDPATLAAEADAAIAAGDAAAAATRLLEAARLHAAADEPIAALDACYAALAVAPDDAEVHLSLVDLYLDRGWTALAADKLALLARLAELSDDPATLERARALAKMRLPDDPRLAGLTA